MSSSDLDEARRLLEQAEREGDPERKFAALDEGIDILEAYAADPSVSDQQRTYASNFRRSNIRRLLNQLVDMRDLQFHAWLNYIKLLLLRLETDVKAILEEDPSLQDRYDEFVGLWRDELMELLQGRA